MSRLWPRRLTGQLIASLLLALIVAQALTLLIFHDERRAAIRAASRGEILSRTAAMVRLLNTTPAEFHQRIIESASGPRLRFSLAERGLLQASGTSRRDQAVHSVLTSMLASDAREVRVRVDHRGAWPFGEDVRPRRREREHDADDDDDERSQRRGPEHRRERRPIGLTLAVLPLAPRWLNVETLIPPATPAWALPSLATLAVTALALVAIVVLAVRRVARPLVELAAAAQRLGRGEMSAPVHERGPEDVRLTIRAFNDMQTRLERFVRERTQMLAAISHDLRTPITSLRLRAELIDDDDNRGRILEILDEMQSMAEATLAFVREDSAREATRTVELAALVDSVCADLSDLGHDATFASGEPTPYACRPLALKRAVRNLIENAVTYGERARVSLTRSGEELVIAIEDDGPGIPDRDLDRVFEPFVRLEESRSRETGGVGLGLAIAASIASAHGGTLRLENRRAGGLRAELRLPYSQASRVEEIA